MDYHQIITKLKGSECSGLIVIGHNAHKRRAIAVHAQIRPLMRETCQFDWK